MPLCRRHLAKIAFARVLEEREGLIVQRHECDIGIAIVVEVAKIEPHARR